MQKLRFCAARFFAKFCIIVGDRSFAKVLVAIKRLDLSDEVLAVQ